MHDYLILRPVTTIKIVQVVIFVMPYLVRSFEQVTDDGLMVLDEDMTLCGKMDM